MKAKEFNIKWGMVIDLDKCTGCGACMTACQVENNIAPMVDASNKMRTLSWMLVYELSNKKAAPDAEIAYLPRPCMQCGNPACVPVCPVVATDKNEEGGIVSQIYPRCIGCRYCMVACPYHARRFNWWDPEWPKPMEAMLSPEVSPRMRGVVEKCTFCHHRLLAARSKAYLEETELDKVTYSPACVEACPTKAIIFGNLRDPDSEVTKLSKDPRAFRILEKLKTEPKVYYLSKYQWVHKLGDKGL